MKKAILVGLIIVSMLAVFTMAMAADTFYGVFTWNSKGTKAYASSTASPSVHQYSDTSDSPMGSSQPYTPGTTSSF